EAGRSTLYASDLAKGFKVPIVHVNADDPEAAVEVTRLAAAYRARFHKDFLIDLIGYRRYGHNEGDEPAFTQPVMYEKIRRHPTVRAIWAQKLVERGVIDEGRPAELVSEARARLQAAYDALQPEEDLAEDIAETPPAGAARRVDTSVPLETLQARNEALLPLPDGLRVMSERQRFSAWRDEALQAPVGGVVDWAAAEELARATIIAEGSARRRTGEDVERGTFSQS